MIPGVAVIGLDGGLFFATADALEDRIRGLVRDDGALDGLVLDCGGIDFVDSQGSAKLAEIVRLTEESGVVLRLARLKPAVEAVLERDGVLVLIGADRLHANIDQAVAAQQAEAPRRRARHPVLPEPQ